MLSRLFAKDSKDAWRFFSVVFWWALFAVSLLTIIAWIWATPLAKLVAPGFSPEQSERLAYFLRLILPAQVFFVSGACFSALLFLRKQFYVPALTPLIYNGCIIIFGIGIPYLGIAEGMMGFCVGVSIGAALGAFILPYWAAFRGQGYEYDADKNEETFIKHTVGGVGVQLISPRWQNLRHPQFKYFLYMALPLMLGQSIVMLNEQFMRIFGSMAGDGAISLLSYARRISQVPVGIVGQAMAVASYPFLAALAAQNNFKTFNQTLAKAMHTSTILLLPLSALMIATALPCIGFIFEGGKFSANDTLLAAPLLQIMLLAVPLWGVQMVLGRAFYALGDTLTPALTGTAVTIISLPLFYYSLAYGAMGIAVVSLIGVIAYIVIVGYIWKKRQGSLAFSGLGKDLGAALVFSSISAALAFAISQYTLEQSKNLPSIWPYALALGLSGLGFAIVYGALSFKFYPKLLAPIFSKFRKKVIK